MPPSYRWVIPGRLAGSGQPGLLAPAEEDFAFLAAEGIRTVFTLTERPLSEPMRDPRFLWEHFPIDDMRHPTPRAAEGFCTRVADAMRQGAVLVHCKAGLGRTGTMLACVLVSLGKEPQEAIREVRRVNPGYLQTPGQERFIAHFAEHLQVGAQRAAST